MVGRLDYLGAVVALLIYATSVIVFSARMMFGLRPGHWIGIPFLLMALPLGFLLCKAPGLDRPVLYYIQVGLMLASVVAVFLLDYALELDWRSSQWAVISFVVLYFAGIGGMIGVASRAGRAWTISAVVGFFATAGLAFIQRAVTGV